MRIAFVYDGIYPFSIGGVEMRVWRLAKGLSSRGHDVHIFGMKYWEGKDVIVRDGLCLHGVCKPQKLYANGRRTIKEAVYFAAKVLLPLVKDSFDIIDCQNFPYFPCFSAKLASVIRRSRLIITWHEVWGDYWFNYLGKKGTYGKIIERIVARLTADVTAVSDMTKRDLERIGAKGDIRLIPNGVDLTTFNDVTPSNQGSDIIFAGRLIREKNVDLLIKSISFVRQEIPNISCIIIGDGPERSNLERLIHELNLESNILVTGFVEDNAQVISYLKASKVFALPSAREGFGIVALEANACGLPVITVSHPRNAACELITEGENGFICQPSPEAIAEKIPIALTKGGGMRETCIQFSKKYDWNEILGLAERYYIESLTESLRVKRS